MTTVLPSLVLCSTTSACLYSRLGRPVHLYICTSSVAIQLNTWQDILVPADLSRVSRLWNSQERLPRNCWVSSICHLHRVQDWRIPHGRSSLIGGLAEVLYGVRTLTPYSYICTYKNCIRWDCAYVCLLQNNVVLEILKPRFGHTGAVYSVLTLSHRPHTKPKTPTKKVNPGGDPETNNQQHMVQSHSRSFRL